MSRFVSFRVVVFVGVVWAVGVLLLGVTVVLFASHCVVFVRWGMWEVNNGKVSPQFPIWRRLSRSFQPTVLLFRFVVLGDSGSGVPMSSFLPGM